MTLARVGLLGGTFDPIHVGHLIIAESTYDQLGLDHVEFIPASDPPHKPEQSVSPAHHRLTMVETAIADIDRFVVNHIELNRVGPSYTADTLDELRSTRPGDEFHFIVGGDSLRDLPAWQDPQRIVSLARLAVISRPGAAFDLAALERDIPGLVDRLDFINAPMIDIASRWLRASMRDGRSVRFQVPDSVIDYAGTHHLYR
jgi:nicotinate-nucleotide adenylyltransferase